MKFTRWHMAVSVSIVKCRHSFTSGALTKILTLTWVWVPRLKAFASHSSPVARTFARRNFQWNLFSRYGTWQKNQSKWKKVNATPWYISNIIFAIPCRLRSTVGNIKKGREGVLMELKLFQFYFRQLLVIRNTYFVENNGMKKKKGKKKNANIISIRISWILS